MSKLGAKKNWIYYNSNQISSAFCVDEFGGNAFRGKSYFEETRVNHLVQFVYKGVCHLTVWANGEPRDYVVRAGEAFIIRAGVRHSYASDANEPCSRYWFSFSGSESENILRRCRIKNDDVIIKGIPLEEVAEHFFKFYQTLRIKGDSAFAMYSVAYSLLDMLMRINFKSLSVAGNIETENQILINGVVEYIKNNLATVTVKGLVVKFGYERSYLYRLFMQARGMSLQEYIIISRIKHARYLLVETQERAEDIAIALGYESYASFSKMFSKRTGFSPVEYRKIYKKRLKDE